MFFLFEGVWDGFREGESHGCCKLFKVKFFLFLLLLLYLKHSLEFLYDY